MSLFLAAKSRTSGSNHRSYIMPTPRSVLSVPVRLLIAYSMALRWPITVKQGFTTTRVLSAVKVFAYA